MEPAEEPKDNLSGKTAQLVEMKSWKYFKPSGCATMSNAAELLNKLRKRSDDDLDKGSSRK